MFKRASKVLGLVLGLSFVALFGAAGCGEENSGGTSGTGGKSGTGGSGATGGTGAKGGTGGTAGAGGTAGMGGGGLGGLGGTGGMTTLDVTPENPTFPATPINPSSPPAVEFTVTNNANFDVTNMMVATTPVTDFLLQDNDCQGTLRKNSDCTFEVIFRPSTEGEKTAQLTVRSNQSPQETIQLRAIAEPGGGLALTPTFQDFGQVNLNTASEEVSFDLTNNAADRSGALTFAIEGVNAAEFNFMSNACPSTLAAGEKCAMSLVMRPTTEGSKAGTLKVTEAGNATPVQATLAGLGKSSGALTVTPSQHDFGDITIGAQSTQVFSVKNVGLDPTGALTANLIGGSGNYAVDPGSTCQDLILNPTESCDVVVVFKPLVVGDSLSTLRVSGTPGGQVSVTLNGTGVAVGDLLELDPTSKDFGDVTVGSTSTFLFTLRNKGLVDSGIPAFNIVGTGNNFTATPSDACKVAITPGGSCLVTVEFKPQNSGEKGGTLIATATPGGQVTAELAGKGMDPITITPSDKDFGEVKINQPSGPTDLFTIRNNGAVKTGALQINLNAGGGNDFEVTSNTCANGGTGVQLDPNTECFITIEFNPTTTGDKAASLTVTASPGGAASASIHGEGVASGITIEPTAHDFGNANVGSAGPTRLFTLRNDGNVNTGPLQVTINPQNPADYTILNDNCSNRSIGPTSGPTCTLTVRFSPKAIGDRQATLNAFASPGGNASATLLGTGTSLAQLLVEPTSYDYGSVSMNDSSVHDHEFVVRNNSDNTLTGLTVGLVGGNGVGFNQGSNSCTTSLAPRSTCSIWVEFNPLNDVNPNRARTLQASATAPGNVTVTATSVLTGVALP